jgi:phenylacetate-coenzyme A ligase PaaK-like adenylate-forming protein
MLKIQPERLFSIQHEADFQALALTIFQYQANHIPVYQQYLNALKIDPAKIQTIQEIPFLPIEFFKNNSICADPTHREITFSSSGTTGNETSKHPVNDLKIYKQRINIH